MRKDIVIFVRTDFLKHEKEFNLMRDFVLNLNPKDIKFFDEFNYDSENDKMVHIHNQPIHKDYSNFSLICDKLENGYMALSLYELNQFFS